MITLTFASWYCCERYKSLGDKNTGVVINWCVSLFSGTTFGVDITKLGRNLSCVQKKLVRWLCTCIDILQVVYRWCTGGVQVVYRWCTGGVLMQHIIKYYVEKKYV